MAKFDIIKIAHYLGRYKDQLDELYDWSFDFQRLVEFDIISETDLHRLQSSGLSHFQKTEELKHVLCRALTDCEIGSQKFVDIALWIIHDWGRISRASNHINTMRCVTDFLLAEKPSFDRIASSSKVGAFMDPTERIIYDSRVAYTMNWIILSENAGDRFFPMPEGRNRKMNAFDVNVLIHLKFMDIYRPDNTDTWMSKYYISNKDKGIYIPKTDAYTELNTLVGKVNEVLWNDARKMEPFYTEMLLFALADKGVFREITKRVRIEIE